MATKTRATAAERRALEAIRDGAVQWYYGWGRPIEPSWRTPQGVGTRSVQRVVDKRWARVGKNVSPLASEVVLTDAGREVLDAHA